MAMIIRVLYNNQDWQDRCQAPGKDSDCWQCYYPNVAIKPPKPYDEVCSGNCWEQRLRTEYRWGCTPHGRRYGSRAYPGATVFFVFKQRDGNYTLWGKTTVRSVDDKIVKAGRDDEVGFAFIHFNHFNPLPRHKWVKNLSDVQLIGGIWKRGRHRYIGADKERYLEQLIQGSLTGEQVDTTTIAPPSKTMSLHIELAPNIYKRLEGAAVEEGRQIEEIIREAIAEWLKDR